MDASDTLAAAWGEACLEAFDIWNCCGCSCCDDRRRELQGFAVYLHRVAASEFGPALLGSRHPVRLPQASNVNPLWPATYD